jgi:CSLREA domain-containing protein
MQFTKRLLWIGFFLIVGAIIAFATVVPTHAAPQATITVNTLADTIATDGVCSLREAIQSANLGMPIGSCAAGTVGLDTIIISVTGTITLGSALPDITQDLNIGGPGSEVLTISGAGLYRPLKVNSGVQVNLVGVTIANGFTASGGGGGIYNAGALTVTQSVIFNNQASTVHGGGIYNFAGRVTLNTSSVYSNATTLNGGGVNNDFNGALTVTNSQIFSNTAGGFAGGFFTNQGTVYLTGSSIYNNAGVTGGAMYTQNTVTLTIARSSIHDNRATSFAGGGIYSTSGINELSKITVTNSTLYNNTAGTTGGGIFFNGSNGTLNLINSTVAFNKAGPNYAGNIVRNLGTVTLQNTIVANSVSSANCAGTIMDGGNNLQFGGTVANACGATIATGDPKLAPFDYYGGLTRVLALSEGSAAINAGNNSICAASPVNNLDQRGYPRPVGAACDIGAFEGMLTQFYLPLVLK